MGMIGLIVTMVMPRALLVGYAVAIGVAVLLNLSR